MKAYSIFLFSTLILASVRGQGSDEFTWPEAYKSAVIMTYDDGLDCHLDVAVPALDEHGLKGTFYCTGDSRSLYERTEEWRDIVRKGHEMGNHTLYHPCNADGRDWVTPERDLRNYSIAQIRDELYVANILLKAVDGKRERTFAYTCTDTHAGGESFIGEVRKQFVAARGGGSIPEDMQAVDIYNTPSWGVDDPSGEEMIAYVKEAQEKGTVAIFMFHSVGGGYLNVSAEAHNQLLDYLVENQDEIWTDTFMNVMSWVKQQRQ